MNINEKYQDLWQLKEDTYRSIDYNKPLIIYLDGKHVTNNHKDYNLLETPNFTNRLIETAEKICIKLHLEAELYAGIDELSIIIKNPYPLKKLDVGDNANYIDLIFIQYFIKDFFYPEVVFKSTIFNISIDDIPRFIHYRKDICLSGALWYIAKEHLPKDEYRELNENSDMENLLKNRGLWEIFEENKQLREGIYKSISPMDNILFQRFS